MMQIFANDQRFHDHYPDDHIQSSPVLSLSQHKLHLGRLSYTLIIDFGYLFSWPFLYSLVNPLCQHLYTTVGVFTHLDGLNCWN